MNQEEIVQQLQVGMRALQSGSLDIAENVFRNILSVTSLEVHSLHFLGVVLCQKGNLDDGAALIEKSIGLDPSRFAPYLNMGRFLVGANQWDRAVAFLEQAVQRDASNFDAWSMLAQASFFAGNADAALKAGKKAAEINPGNAEIFFCLGVYASETNKDEAIDHYRNVISIDPASFKAWVNLGNSLLDCQRIEDAIAAFVEALKVDSNCFEALMSLSIARFKKGELILAAETARKAISVKPDSADAYLNLGNVLKEEGEVEQAIASYRKAIEVKTDFVDAYLTLGRTLAALGMIDEARHIVASLRQMKPLEDEALINIEDKTLVFDWHHRRALDLFWEVEHTSAEIESTSLAAVKQVEALCFPSLFLGNQIDRVEGKQLYDKGYLVDEGLVSRGFCADLISQFKDGNELASEALLEAVLANGVLRAASEKILWHTGFPHLIWNCIYVSKGPSDGAVSDDWHYDNHYNIWTPKLMVYLNSQSEDGGATHFVDAVLSKQISERSDYMGLVWQRKTFANRVKGLVTDLSLNPDTLDPEHYVFSPESAGSGVWFCPARVLHRGVSPNKGVRHVLSFSLTPLPADCGWSVDQCVEKSVEILQDKIKSGMQKSDANPYWVFAEISSDEARN